MVGYDTVRVFSCTKAREREVLGERVSDWLRSSGAQLVGVEVRQSSDEQYHCMSVVLFCRCGTQKGGTASVPRRRRKETK